MKKAINKTKNYFSTNFEVLAATIIFIGILVAGIDFYIVTKVTITTNNTVCLKCLHDKNHI